MLQRAALRRVQRRRAGEISSCGWRGPCPCCIYPKPEKRPPLQQCSCEKGGERVREGGEGGQPFGESLENHVRCTRGGVGGGGGTE